MLAVLLLVAAGVCLGDEPEDRPDKFVMSLSAPRMEQRFVEIVAMRATAIDHALGPILEDACTKITVDFAVASEDTYPRFDSAAYDPTRHTLTFRRGVLGMVSKGVRSWSRSYWPYYQNDEARQLLPVIEIIDDALWMTHLREAAHRKGVTWPHQECSSLAIEKRLGCEMLVSGVLASRRPPQMFNANRLDLLWPEDLHEVRARGWRRDGAYRDVQELGGSLLIRPLIAQFGVPRVLAYIAQTPFHIQDDNVRASAVQYQEQASQALSVDAINR